MVLMKKQPYFKISTYQKMLIYFLMEGLNENNQITSTIKNTEVGIANNLRISLSTASRTLNKMLENKDVKVNKRYINGLNRQVKTFFLTLEGLQKKKDLEEILIKQNILIKDKNDIIHEVKLSQVDHYFSTNTTMFEKIESISKDGILDYKFLKKNIDKFSKNESKIIINIKPDISTPKFFYGREKELAQLKKWISFGKTKLIIIYAIAGFGKTILASKLISDFEDKKNTFWYNLHDWDKSKDILKSLSDFLTKIGKKKLKCYLKTKENYSFNEIYQILEIELKGIEAIFVFDNCEKADKETIQLFSLLKELIEKTENIKVLILSRTELSFYDLRDLEIKKIIEEMHLNGLDEKSTMDLLRSKDVDEFSTREIYKETYGHPLSLEILAIKNDDLKLVNKQEINRKKLNEFQLKIFDKEIFEKLDDDEKELVKFASIFRTKVTLEAYLINKKIKYSTVIKLQKKLLIYQTINGNYNIHNFIKKCINIRFQKKVNKDYHLNIAKYYEDIGNDLCTLEAFYHLLKAREYDKLCELLLSKGNDLISHGFLVNIEKILKEIPVKYIIDNNLSKTLLIRGNASESLENLEISI